MSNRSGDGVWLDAEHTRFSVTRSIVPGRRPTQRGLLNPQHKVGLKGFHRSHSWPLMWGGPEIQEALFLAHPELNLSMIKRVENAGLRAANRLAPHGLTVVATVEVHRAAEADLLDEVFYRFDVVDADGTSVARAEMALKQNLSAAQRTQLAAGLEVEIDRRKLVLRDPDAFLDGDRLNQLVESMRTEGPGRRTRKKAPTSAKPSPRTRGTASETHATTAESRGTGGRRRSAVAAGGAHERPGGVPRATVDDLPHVGKGRRAGATPARLTGDVVTPNLKPGVRGMAKGLVAGLLIPDPSDLVQLGIGLVLAPFEAELEDVNAERLASSYRTFVMPSVTALLQAELPRLLTDPNVPVRNQAVYLTFAFRVVTNEVAEDLADVIVFLYRFVSFRPGFVETFDHTEVDRPLTAAFTVGKPRKASIERSVRELPGGDRQIVYRHLTSLLLSHPRVLAFTERMVAGQVEIDRIVRRLDPALRTLGVRRSGEQGLPLSIGLLMRGHAYQQAASDIGVFIGSLRDTFGDEAYPAIEELNSLQVECEIVARDLDALYRAMDGEQQVLLRATMPYPPVTIDTPPELKALLAGQRDY